MPGNRGNRITIKINEDRFDCTPRQSLETQGSATGKQVEASTALDSRPQPVEQGLPDPVRRWADISPGGETEAPTPPLAANYAESARTRGAGRIGSFGWVRFWGFIRYHCTALE